MLHITRVEIAVDKNI